VSRRLELPDGFASSTRGTFTLVARAGDAEAVRQAGLGEPCGWEQRLAAGAGSAGRGATARIEVPTGGIARLKRLHRGGRIGAVWRDRFPGTRRVLDNLRLPVEAGRRGLATAAPLALLIDRLRCGLCRAWLAVDEIDATDLRTCFAAGRPPTAEEWGVVLRLVRGMHDRGIEHRDLNLGNLLIRRGGEPAAFVVDLDRGRLRAGPLGFGPRQRALRRLERSYVKCCHPGPASDDVRRMIYSDYAAGDTDLARRLERGRPAGRAWIGIHRLGWRR
jgi:hypothetical protein